MNQRLFLGVQRTDGEVTHGRPEGAEAPPETGDFRGRPESCGRQGSQSELAEEDLRLRSRGGQLRVRAGHEWCRGSGRSAQIGRELRVCARHEQCLSSGRSAQDGRKLRVRAVHDWYGSHLTSPASRVDCLTLQPEGLEETAAFPTGLDRVYAGRPRHGPAVLAQMHALRGAGTAEAGPGGHAEHRRSPIGRQPPIPGRGSPRAMGPASSPETIRQPSRRLGPCQVDLAAAFVPLPGFVGVYRERGAA